MGGRLVEVHVEDGVASLPQVKANLASCREREREKTDRKKREKSILHQYSSQYVIGLHFG